MKKPFTLNRLIFENINTEQQWPTFDNQYAPIISHENLALTELTHLNHKRDIFYQSSENQMVNMINDFNDIDFPSLQRLTGNYYFRAVYFSKHAENGKYHVNIVVGLTGWFSGGVITTPTEMDYLGLEFCFESPAIEQPFNLIALDKSVI